MVPALSDATVPVPARTATSLARSIANSKSAAGPLARKQRFAGRRSLCQSMAKRKVKTTLTGRTRTVTSTAVPAVDTEGGTERDLQIRTKACCNGKPLHSLSTCYVVYDTQLVARDALLFQMQKRKLEVSGAESHSTIQS